MFDLAKHPEDGFLEHGGFPLQALAKVDFLCASDCSPHPRVVI